MGRTAVSDTLVSMKGLDFSYRTPDGSIRVLDQVDLNVERGEFTCILGRSGCGKSTLLRILAGFEQHSGGSLLIDGTPLTAPSMERIMIFQEFDQLLPWKSVRENLLFPLRKRFPDESAAQLHERSEQALALTGLSQAAGLYPRQLSGGMKQRAALARALALEPKLLLMDEPFASLDLKTRDSLQQLLLRLWRESAATMLFVTHDIQEAILLSDRLYIMDEREQGRLTCYENPLRRPRSHSMEGFKSFALRIARAFD
ncbi:MAG: ATP-binding cassette domain-containing protein [Spirochaetia bacterium]|nr:ATP-binding cassette domain-containing protein [Spirochaetia bacterium]